MKKSLIALAVFLLSSAALTMPAAAVETGESAITPQVGGVFFSGKLARLFAPDFGYGVDFAYAINDYVAIDFDFLYSAHEQTDSDKYGNLTLAEGHGALGVRAAYTSAYLMPYATLAPTAVWLAYKARYQAGEETDSDKLNSHGFGGSATAGLDVFISNAATVGLAAKAAVVSTDMRFATGADIDNKIQVFTFYTGLVRLTLLF